MVQPRNTRPAPMLCPRGGGLPPTGPTIEVPWLIVKLTFNQHRYACAELRD